MSIIKQHVTWRGGRDFFHLLPQCCLLPDVIKNEKLKSQKKKREANRYYTCTRQCPEINGAAVFHWLISEVSVYVLTITMSELQHLWSSGCSVLQCTSDDCIHARVRTNCIKHNKLFTLSHQIHLEKENRTKVSK